MRQWIIYRTRCMTFSTRQEVAQCKAQLLIEYNYGEEKDTRTVVIITQDCAVTKSLLNKKPGGDQNVGSSSRRPLSLALSCWAFWTTESSTVHTAMVPIGLWDVEDVGLKFLFNFPLHLQSVPVHSANVVKPCTKAYRRVLTSTLLYLIRSESSCDLGSETYKLNLKN
jgi:hypothetical protein